MGPSISAPQQQMFPPTREDPSIELARQREAAALRKQRGRSGTLIAGGLPATGENSAPLGAPLGGAGGQLLGT